MPGRSSGSGAPRITTKAMQENKWLSGSILLKIHRDVIDLNRPPKSGSPVRRILYVHSWHSK
jgi:hypothetical protein